MKIYLTDTSSLMEALYLQATSEEGTINLVSTLAEADTVVGCYPIDLFYDKTIIINNNNFTSESLGKLAEFNKVVSRFPLDSSVEFEYKLEPYTENVKLDNFSFDGSTRNVMSRLSLKSFIAIKNSNKYKLKKPQMFVDKKVKGNNTIIGLLSEQV